MRWLRKHYRELDWLDALIFRWCLTAAVIVALIMGTLAIWFDDGSMVSIGGLFIGFFMIVGLVAFAAGSG